MQCSSISAWGVGQRVYRVNAVQGIRRSAWALGRLRADVPRYSARIQKCRKKKIRGAERFLIMSLVVKSVTVREVDTDVADVLAVLKYTINFRSTWMKS